MSEFNNEFLKEAIRLSEENITAKTGGPFGAVIVKDGVIISEGTNIVTSANDPTAHSEIQAIRAAAKSLNTFNLSGCEIYSSCEPCPMCLAAIYWARIDKLYYANNRTDAANIGFDDEHFYNELNLPTNKKKIIMEQHGSEEALNVFKKWNEMEDKIKY
jgi:tRNA(Arg) A34 adenosine deaminase TadA